MPLTLSAINRFPVKSCRGEALRSALIEPWGLSGDRRWMVVDEDGEAITAREQRRLLLVRPELEDGGLLVRAEGRPDLRVTVPAVPDVKVTVFGRAPLAACQADPAAHAWFSELLGVPARLVYQDEPTRRRLNPDFGEPDDSAAFQDGYPLMMTTAASLAALNELISAGPRADEGPLPMIRFRPSVVVDGSAAWEEDGWRRLRIGAASFRVVKGCDRCVIPTTDAETAARGKEPIATLAKHRRWDGATWFGMQLIPDTPGVTINVGDEVELLESVPAPDGPPR